MPPNCSEPKEIIDDSNLDPNKLVGPQADQNWSIQVSYFRLMLFITYFHLGAVYGFLEIFSTDWRTLVFITSYHIYATVSVTMGAHRLWSHRSFKAKLPLKIILMLGFSAANQNSLLWWTQIHRQHHKYSDTDADPHNATRGLFYSHIGWLFCKRHPEVVNRRRFVDVSDLRNEPVVMFEHKYHAILTPLMAFLVPVGIMLLKGNLFWRAWNINLFRLILGFHTTCLINSFAHAVGYRPYDKKFLATQNLSLTTLSMGEGFHNYHHTFPSDYRSSELGNSKLNLTTFLIDLFAKIGWAYDLRTVSQRAVDSRARLTGDGTDKWGRMSS